MAPSTTAAPAAAPSATPTVYEVDATVIESPTHGPMLCSVVLDSLPPQCGAPNVAAIGWDWTKVEGEETRGGTTWGDFHVTGTWDGKQLTLSEPAGPVQPSKVDRTDTLKSPCPEPPGGWRVVHPATTTEDRMISAMERARTDPAFAGAWLDQSINPALADGPDPGDEIAANDPTKLVLNISTTGDVTAVERAVREVWGGALCVSPATRTDAELTAIQEELSRDGAMSSSPRVELNLVEATFVVADPSMQVRYDSRYGDGAVQISSWLTPVEPK